MAIGYSRHALVFSLILFAQLVSCFYENQMSPGHHPPNLIYDDVPHPDMIPTTNTASYPNQSVNQPSSASTTNCQKCTISVSSVSLYYWPQGSTNTACLATLPSPPSPTVPSGLNPISPSAYALFFSVTINNDCGLTSISPTSIASFDPDALSTLNNGIAQSFNLADLPCPPSNVALQPGQPFQPTFAWNKELFFKSNYEPPECSTIVGLAGWIDPPIALTTDTANILPGNPASPHNPRLRRAPVEAHKTSWIPAKTTTVP